MPKTKPFNKKPRKLSGNYLTLLNKNAGRINKGNKKEIEKAFSHFNTKNEIVDLESFDWQELKTNYKKKNLNALVIAGGDGSLRAASEILYRMDIPLPIGFIPLGSTNWMARSLEVPLKMKAAVQTITQNNPVYIDAGIVNDKDIFLLTACFGKIARVSIDPTRKEKSRLGFLAYVKQLPSLFSRYNFFNFKINLEKEAHSDKAHSIMFVNHLNLHKLRPQRKISFNDGKLHYFSLKNKTWVGLIQAAFEFYFGTKDSRVLKYKEMSEALITNHAFSSSAHLDGDKLELDKGPIKIKVIPKYVRIFTKN